MSYLKMWPNTGKAHDIAPSPGKLLLITQNQHNIGVSERTAEKITPEFPGGKWLPTQFENRKDIAECSRVRSLPEPPHLSFLQHYHLRNLYIGDK